MTVLCILHRGIYFRSLANKQILELLDLVHMDIEDIHTLAIARVFTLNLLIECFNVGAVSAGPHSPVILWEKIG